MDVSAALSLGYGLLSVEGSAAYESLKESITSSKESVEIINEEKAEYQEKVFQIKREVTTTLNINGNIASVIEERFVNTRPLDDGMSSDELRQEAEKYMKHEFGAKKRYKK
eukprot:TRINITY_DN35884_c0_g1_i1.p1 TRINITY_DN35884_c0_g1~~TRINITY_DN35884_c0_g1_i1.p1  ORF type:complete len:111 (-),score=24.81 TRINITY_DN35884_c0_g1_i1:346-678(-)